MRMTSFVAFCTILYGAVLFAFYLKHNDPVRITRAREARDDEAEWEIFLDSLRSAISKNICGAQRGSLQDTARLEGSLRRRGSQTHHESKDGPIERRRCSLKRISVGGIGVLKSLWSTRCRKKSLTLIVL